MQQGRGIGRGSQRSDKKQRPDRHQDFFRQLDSEKGEEGGREEECAPTFYLFMGPFAVGELFSLLFPSERQKPLSGKRRGKGTPFPFFSLPYLLCVLLPFLPSSFCGM